MDSQNLNCFISVRSIHPFVPHIIDYGRYFFQFDIHNITDKIDITCILLYCRKLV